MTFNPHFFDAFKCCLLPVPVSFFSCNLECLHLRQLSTTKRDIEFLFLCVLILFGFTLQKVLPSAKVLFNVASFFVLCWHSLRVMSHFLYFKRLLLNLVDIFNLQLWNLLFLQWDWTFLTWDFDYRGRQFTGLGGFFIFDRWNKGRLRWLISGRKSKNFWCSKNHVSGHKVFYFAGLAISIVILLNRRKLLQFLVAVGFKRKGRTKYNSFG